MRSAKTQEYRTLIQPSSGWVSLGLGELWQYRELLLAFVQIDLRIRYKQTILGVAWALLQPIITMSIFTVVFGRFAKIPSDGVPYAIFSFTALVP